jgi:hypothetical protein
LLNVEERPDLFKQVGDELPTKLLEANAKMKLKAEKRNKRKQLRINGSTR